MSHYTAFKALAFLLQRVRPTTGHVEVRAHELRAPRLARCAPQTGHASQLDRRLWLGCALEPRADYENWSRPDP